MIQKKTGRRFAFEIANVHKWPTQFSESENDYDVFNKENEVICFLFGKKYGEYYKVYREILSNKCDIYIHHDITLDNSYFIADSIVSIFRLLIPFVTGDIYLGDDYPSAITNEGFIDVIKNFPNGYEKKKYVEAKISAVLREHFGHLKDAEKSYHKYMNKRV